METKLSVVVFVATLVATLFVSYLGRLHEASKGRGSLAKQGLSWWLVGLSAGATANSGFVVTAAVGLGYRYGARWLLLPLGWLVGDIVFWLFFPHRINRLGAEVEARTLTDVLVCGTQGRPRLIIQKTVGLISLICLGGYVSAQWLSGQKFLSGAFGFGHEFSLFVFAAVIIVYSGLGGFRGSVYTDTFQAIIRIVGTTIAIVVVGLTASRNSASFWDNIKSAGPDFLHLIPTDGAIVAVVSCVGFAAASIGFGLGQPQMITRYLAGASPQETRSAWWVYILFVQVTWIAMTCFGIALRGVMPSLEDPEMGLSVFHRSTTGPIITGIIAADIFATIAATSNGILVAMAQSLVVDLCSLRNSKSRWHGDLLIPVLVIGISTMTLSLFLHGSVKDLALSSVGIMGAGLAPAMMIQVLGWRRTSQSLLATIFAGFLTAAIWMQVGYNSIINEAAPGMLVGLIVNIFVVTLFSSERKSQGVSLCQPHVVEE